MAKLETRRDWVRKNLPEYTEGYFDGGVFGCPHSLRYKAMPGWHEKINCEHTCEDCWSQPLPKTMEYKPPEKLDNAKNAPSFAFVKVETETARKRILDEAAQIVCNDRNKQYGEPEDNFETIASLWNPYLSAQLGQDVHLDGADVGMLMTLFKCGRIMSGQAKRDNYVDAAGYIACAAEIALKE